MKVRLLLFVAAFLFVSSNIFAAVPADTTSMQPLFAAKPTGEGTGLGLSLTYDIVVKGNGRMITVDSKAGEFSCFTITLPVDQVS